MENIIAEIQVSYKTRISKKEKVTSAEKAYDIFLCSWSMQTLELQEEFKVMLLNRANEVLGIYPLSKGGTSGTVVDVKLLFAVVLKCNASGIIICHNHPSGNCKPSQNDIALTKKVKSGAELLDIQFVDHLIITKDNFYSFSSEGF